MTTAFSRSRISFLVVIAVLCLAAASARACPVCFGDPESDMVKGAEAGVLFMVGVVYTVLIGFVGFIAFWTVRARRIRLQGGPVDSPGSDASTDHLDSDIPSS